MTLAVGPLLDASTLQELGTVFAATRRLAVTSFHCIGDRETGKISHRRVRCQWGPEVSDAVVCEGDPLIDVAILQLRRLLPDDLEPVALASNAVDHVDFIAPGACAPSGVFKFAVTGEISWSAAQLAGGVPAIQLWCRQSAAGLSLHGLSGAPVLVGRTRRAVGVIRWNPPQRDRVELAEGAVVYATPTTAVLHRWPQLMNISDLDEEDLSALIKRLLDRGSTRNPATVCADVIRLLGAGRFGLGTKSLGDVQTEDARIILHDGMAVIEIDQDLRDSRAVGAAEDRLAACIAAQYVETGQRYVGLLTDGVQWLVYLPDNGTLRPVTSLTLDQSVPDSTAVLEWLESALAIGAQVIKPTPREINRQLGATSPAYAISAAELTMIYESCRELPTVAVKRSVWAKLLTTAAGSNFTDDDSLFIDHTLLVAMAKVIGHAVMGIDPQDPVVDAAALMSGALFADAQIGGVIESDFFDWITEVPGGPSFVKNLARRLARFAWGDVDHDVMKTLYESIVPQEVRHRLGEYYTPDWLAEEIIAKCVADPLIERVLDASCGSGTFLFHLIRSYLAAADTAGRAGPHAIRGVVRHVIGIDVHPVAVTLARVTYLLAIGMHRLQAEDRPAFSVPVYLGDALQWGEEKTMLSYEGLSVPLDHDSFVSGSTLTGQSSTTNQLLFPDPVVADAQRFDRLMTELANSATQRTPKTPVPSLKAIFQRYDIAHSDRPTMERTFDIMCHLHDQGKDHIWGYYVRNVARPAWLTRDGNRVDVLVGNPPWLSYRHMTAQQQASFKAMSMERGLWTGAVHATHQDLAALFVTRCIELYLCPGGKFGYVMPWATLQRGPNSRGQYAGFRTGRYSTHSEPVHVAFEKPWDLHQVKPSFFPVPASVIFGRRQRDSESPAPLGAIPEVWSGRFETKTASRAEASAHISRIAGEPPLARPLRVSPYAARFNQGATVVPRFLFLVEPDSTGLLGTGAGRKSICSRRGAREKKPWKDLPPLRGTVESEFIRTLYLGESILPFRCLPPLQAVFPWDGQRLLRGDDDQLDLFPGLAKWWRSAETTWIRHRSSQRLSLVDRLDYMRSFSQQFPLPRYRVAYTKSGMYLAAAIISDPDAVIDHKLYWGYVDTLDEARFLVSVLNSEVLTMAIRSLQARGEHNPRDFDKLVFQVPIPIYDAHNSIHRLLSELGARSEQITARLALPNLRFESQRRFIRDALSKAGIASNVNSLVKELLA